MMPPDPVPFSEVLAAELDQIEAARKARGVTAPVAAGNDSFERARHSELLGLAFSGGGIRSATFNLGVLQGLANHGLLTQLDYLSTVSGGGYIGSWFISLLRANGREKQVQQVQTILSPVQSPDPNTPEQRPIHFLRRYSNYLTPHFSFLSADVWAMAVTWLRNFLVNLLQLVALIGAVLVAPRLFGLLFDLWWRFSTITDVLLTVIPLTWVTGAICWAMARKSGWSQKRVQFAITIESLLAALFLAGWLRARPQDLAGGAGFWGSFEFLCAGHLAIGICTRFRGAGWAARPKNVRDGLFICWVLAIAAAVPALATALILWKAAGALAGQVHELQYSWALLTWGPPAILLVLSLGVVVQIGMLGRDLDAGAREWLGRLRAWTLIYSFGWLVVFACSIYGPLWVALLFLWHPWTAWGLSATWLASTIGGVLSGKSAAASGKPASAGTLGGGNATLEWITKITPFVFMAGFVLALAFGLHAVLIQDLYSPDLSDHTSHNATGAFAYAPPGATVSVTQGGAPPPKSWLGQMPGVYFRLLWCSSTYWIGWQQGRTFINGAGNLFLVLIGVAVLLSFRLDINVFSLHEFYKNRLVRCYLGATRKERHPDRFTFFDEEDDQPLENFTTHDQGHYYGPYPVLNATLNVSPADLATQERKGAPFIFTPQYCGYNVERKGYEAMRIAATADAAPSAAAKIADYAYRPTGAFCRPHQNTRGKISLGTAVSVSGAAANPNQGYHTSAAVAFLMTVFDVRLGWWVGNPRDQRTYWRSTPLFNLRPLIGELFGLTDARAPYVNLSDGGHFDNMGLYELIRRGCHYIILSDAEQDADLTFSSLTTTIRNCRTDFGVEIKIGLDRIAKNAAGFSGTHCVVGTIRYPQDKDNDTGYLLYLKSSLTGDEPSDVIGYHTNHPEFPHQSTADQWFTESQFEAYRNLGLHVAETALGGVRAGVEDRRLFFGELKDQWYPPSDRVDKFSAKHTAQLTDLTLAFADEDRLSFLDPQILKGWDKGEEIRGRWDRNAAYRCTAFIDFMLGVFTDLNLESDAEQKHPHNAGWIEIFKHWVQQEIFQRTWAKTKENYSRRFQVFYEDLVKSAEGKRNGPD